MNIDFAEFDKISTLKAKRVALDKAIKSESEVVQVAFRQNRNEARAIVERIDKAWEEKLLNRYKDPPWFGNPLLYFVIGGAISFLGKNNHALWTLGAVLVLLGVGLYFYQLIKLNQYSRESDDAYRTYEMLEFRWCSLVNSLPIYFCLFHREEERLNALRPISDREMYLEVWSHKANEWLNTECSILNEITQRHSPHKSEWRNELDESREEYLEIIKTLRG